LRGWNRRRDRRIPDGCPVGEPVDAADVVEPGEALSLTAFTAQAVPEDLHS